MAHWQLVSDSLDLFYFLILPLANKFDPDPHYFVVLGTRYMHSKEKYKMQARYHASKTFAGLPLHCRNNQKQWNSNSLKMRDQNCLTRYTELHNVYLLLTWRVMCLIVRPGEVKALSEKEEENSKTNFRITCRVREGDSFQGTQLSLHRSY